MIRNTYGHKRWTFPGGKIDAGETPQQTAERETFEEVGVTVNSPTFLGSFVHQPEYKHDTVYCYWANTLNHNFTIDPVEILETEWFPVDTLPPHSTAAEKVLTLYRAKKIR